MRQIHNEFIFSIVSTHFKVNYERSQQLMKNKLIVAFSLLHANTLQDFLEFIPLIFLLMIRLTTFTFPSKIRDHLNFTLLYSSSNTTYSFSLLAYVDS